MTLAGSYRFPEIETTVTGDAVDLPLLGRVRASASVVANTKIATISAIDLRRGTSVITGDVVADVTKRRWSGKLHVDAPNAAELQDTIPEAWRVAGPISADAILGGTFDNYTLDIDHQRHRAAVGGTGDRSRRPRRRWSPRKRST